MACLTQMQGSVLTMYDLDNVIICRFVLEISLLLACLVWRCALPSITKLIHKIPGTPAKNIFLSLGCTNALCCPYSNHRRG
jgi:hypothetical protein